MAAEPTVVFFPEGAYGPTNNCVGIGQVLQSRGVRVVFIIEESFAGTLEARGFEERLMRLGPPPEVEEAPGQFWKDFIAATSPEFRKPTIEQLETFIAPTMGALVDGARYVEDRLCEIIDELQPDIVVRGQRLHVPGAARPGRSAGRASSRATRPRSSIPPCRPCSRATRPATAPAGTSSGRRTTSTSGRSGRGFDEFCQRAWRAAPAAALSSSTSRPT